jgi:hypothetical protein
MFPNRTMSLCCRWGTVSWTEPAYAERVSKYNLYLSVDPAGALQLVILTVSTLNFADSFFSSDSLNHYNILYLQVQKSSEYHRI